MYRGRQWEFSEVEEWEGGVSSSTLHSGWMHCASDTPPQYYKNEYVLLGSKLLMLCLIWWPVHSGNDTTNSNSFVQNQIAWWSGCGGDSTQNSQEWDLLRVEDTDIEHGNYLPSPTLLALLSRGLLILIHSTPDYYYFKWPPSWSSTIALVPKSPLWTFEFSHKVIGFSNPIYCIATFRVMTGVST